MVSIMAKPKITFYVDIVSPFGYIGYYVLRNLPIFRTCEITYIPIFLGGLMKKCNNNPPLAIKNKNRWINNDRHRWSAYFDVPMKDDMPSNFPPNTMTVQRVLCALQMSTSNSGGVEKVAKAMDVLYEAMWVQHSEITESAVLLSILSNAIGEDAAKTAVEKASGAEAKSKLIENTEQAFASGAFGLPWFECMDGHGRTEGFWGVDHLAQVVEFLGLERPEGRGWRAML